MSFVTELLASIVGEGAANTAEQPIGRALAELRRRVTLPLVGLTWLGSLGAMASAWVLASETTQGFLRGAAILVFILGPVPALVLSRFWIDRRDA